MSSFKFGQVTVASKNFYKTRQITNLFSLDTSKIVVSDATLCNNSKDKRYTIGYISNDGVIALLYIKTPKNVFSTGVTQYSENSSYTMSFDMDDHQDWLEKYKLVWNQVEQQTSQSFTKDPVNKDRYLNSKLKTWKDRINTNFHGKDVPYNTRCEATAILKIGSVYQQGDSYYPQVYLEECKYLERMPQLQLFLSDSEDDDSNFE